MDWFNRTKNAKERLPRNTILRMRLGKSDPRSRASSHFYSPFPTLRSVGDSRVLTAMIALEPDYRALDWEDREDGNLHERKVDTARVAGTFGPRLAWLTLHNQPATFRFLGHLFSSFLAVFNIPLSQRQSRCRDTVTRAPSLSKLKPHHFPLANIRNQRQKSSTTLDSTVLSNPYSMLFRASNAVSSL